MPVYEYKCLDCGRHFEATQSIKDNPLESCDVCGGSVTRLISRSSFSLKGGGWYRDGYSKSVGEKKAAPEKKTEAAKQTPSSGKPTKDAS